VPREIIVDWTTIAGGGRVSVFFFTDGNPIASQRTALATFLGSVDGFLHSSTTWVIRTSGRELDDATGALTGTWTAVTGHGGIGGGSTGPIPDASQVLVRWKTSAIVAGRFLQGRTFLPGLDRANLTDGNLTSSVQTSMSSDAQGLASAGVGLSVWHRPVLGAGGQREDADLGTVWSELAVLRRRRS